MSFTELKFKNTELNEAETKVQAYITSYCKVLPTFLESLTSCKEDGVLVLKNISNLSEQLHHVEKNVNEESKELKNIQKTLQFKITSLLEDELCAMKKIVNKLHKTYSYLKTKLMNLEKLSLELDWNKNSEIIIGTATHPKLSLLLDLSLKFWCSISVIYNNICHSFKGLDVRKRKTVINFNNSFKFSLNNADNDYLLAITEFIRNKNIHH